MTFVAQEHDWLLKNEKLCALVSPDGHSPQRHHIACSTRVHSAATG